MFGRDKHSDTPASSANWVSVPAARGHGSFPQLPVLRLGSTMRLRLLCRPTRIMGGNLKSSKTQHVGANSSRLRTATCRPSAGLLLRDVDLDFYVYAIGYDEFHGKPSSARNHAGGVRGKVRGGNRPETRDLIASTNPPHASLPGLLLLFGLTIFISDTLMFRAIFHLPNYSKFPPIFVLSGWSTVCRCLHCFLLCLGRTFCFTKKLLSCSRSLFLSV